ncbi:MAG: hypothetical protein AAGD43_00875 [Pseudomonadota bacterium]
MHSINVVKALQKAKLTKDQAETLIQHFLLTDHELSTKQDLADVEKRLRRDLVEQANGLRTEITDLTHKMYALHGATLVMIVGLMAAVVFR